MQLKRLYIKDYKILKDFTYEFPLDFKHYANVLIGVNGSGKSTILEAIAEIFSCVALNEKAKFGFELEYKIWNERIFSKSFGWSKLKEYYAFVKVFAEEGNKPKIGVDLNDTNTFIINSINEIENSQSHKSISTLLDDYRMILPENIVIYYSGLSEIMSNICKPHNKKLSDSLRKGIADKKTHFYYHEPELFGSILMSLLSYEYGDVPKFLTEKAKITGMQSIQIRLRKPHWGKDTIQNFWGAVGEVRNFLDYLNENSAPIKDLKEPNASKGFGNIVIEVVSDESIIITIITQERLFEIREHLIEEKALFKILHTMHIDDMLDDISFSLYKEEDGKSETFSILSEGEQQAITIKGLSELLAEKNTLFLFDEPDTYLHPKWQRQFITEIEESIQQNFINGITYLIATHSPQILSNAEPDKTHVKIIENGQLIESTPKYYGREISSILYNLMGVEERNKTIRNDLSNLFTLIEDEEIEDAQTELQRLTEILGETDPDIKNAAIQIEYLKEDEADN